MHTLFIIACVVFWILAAIWLLGEFIILILKAFVMLMILLDYITRKLSRLFSNKSDNECQDI